MTFEECGVDGHSGGSAEAFDPFDAMAFDRSLAEALFTFFVACERGSLVKAGSSLGMSGTAVRNRLTAIERRLSAYEPSIQLVEPSGPFRLTTHGRRLWEAVQPIYSAYCGAVAVTTTASAAHLSVACDSVPRAVLLPRVLKRVRELHPALRFSIRDWRTQDAPRVLVEGEVRFLVGALGRGAAAATSVSGSGLAWVPVEGPGLVAVWPNDNECTTREIARRARSSVLMAADLNSASLLDWWSAFESEATFTQVPSHDDAIRLALAAFGIAVVPGILACGIQGVHVVELPAAAVPEGYQRCFDLRWIGDKASLSTDLERDFVTIYKLEARAVANEARVARPWPSIAESTGEPGSR